MGDALREVDADGNAVGTSGSVKHSINTFAPQKFTFAPQENDITIGTATATKISFSTPFKGLEASKLTVDTYVITRPGHVGTDTETWGVRSGDVKFNLALADWHWCGDGADCNKGQSAQVGAFIDVDVSVKGSKAAKASGGGKSVSLGGGATIELSNKVLVDGAWTTMPEGYPMIVIKGSSTTFTFRFPKFASSALYDPVISSANVEPLLTETERAVILREIASNEEGSDGTTDGGPTDGTTDGGPTDGTTDGTTISAASISSAASAAVVALMAAAVVGLV